MPIFDEKTTEISIAIILKDIETSSEIGEYIQIFNDWIQKWNSSDKYINILMGILYFNDDQEKIRDLAQLAITMISSLEKRDEIWGDCDFLTSIITFFCNEIIPCNIFASLIDLFNELPQEIKDALRQCEVLIEKASNFAESNSKIMEFFC